jgi:DNA-binding beta-propeller fold protein YncE
VKHVHVGTGPHEAAVSPDGRWAVVTIYGTQTPGNQLAIIDLTRDSAVRTIDLGVYTRPHGVVFLGGSSSRVAVTSESTGNVVIVDIASGSIDPVPTQARGSHMVAIEASGRRGWTGNISDNSVSELDLEGGRFVRSFAVPSRPEGIAVTPDGSQVWVGSNDTGAVSVISTAAGEVVHTLRGATFPYRLASSPDGRRMVVVDAMGHSLRIADVATHAWIGDIPLDSPRGAVVAADNRTAYVTLAGGAVAVVDLDELKVLRTFAVEVSPDGVGGGVCGRP